jgi:hypothetical protein
MLVREQSAAVQEVGHKQPHTSFAMEYINAPAQEVEASAAVYCMLKKLNKCTCP